MEVVTKRPSVKGPTTEPERAAWDRAERVRDLAEVLAAVDDDGPTVGLVRAGASTVDHLIVPLEGSRPPAVRALHDTALRDVRPGRLRFVTDAVAATGTSRATSATASSRRRSGRLLTQTCRSSRRRSSAGPW